MRPAAPSSSRARCVQVRGTRCHRCSNAGINGVGLRPHAGGATGEAARAAPRRAKRAARSTQHAAAQRKGETPSPPLLLFSRHINTTTAATPAYTPRCTPARARAASARPSRRRSRCRGRRWCERRCCSGGRADRRSTAQHRGRGGERRQSGRLRCVRRPPPTCTSLTCISSTTLLLRATTKPTDAVDAAGRPRERGVCHLHPRDERGAHVLR